MDGWMDARDLEGKTGLAVRWVGNGTTAAVGRQHVFLWTAAAAAAAAAGKKKIR